MTNDVFIKLGHDVHNFEFNYKLVEVTGINHPVTIICDYHGEFTMTPNAHINFKMRCPKCAIEEKIEAKTRALKKKIVDKYVADMPLKYQ